MITRIEIDGFKTFQDFAVDLAPFQVIIGANGCGKSNFFDALRLLSNTADTGLYTSFHSLRGTQKEHFTLLPGGDNVGNMRISVEMLVEPDVRDEYGQQVTLKNPRLRYELGISQQSKQGTEWLYVTHEALNCIPRGEDQWLTRYPAIAGTHPTAEAGAFISTSETEEDDAAIILNTDESGVQQRQPRKFVARDLQATVLSSVHDCDVPHALAARQQMQNWRFESLDTDVMRMTTQYGYPDIPIGLITGNLIPVLLARLNAEDKATLNSISLAMSNLVPNLHKIEVEIEASGRIEVYAVMRDQRRFSVRVLSDGTLRLLTLATLCYVPDQNGVLCYEDPEEDVHPATLRKLVRLMREMTTELSGPEPLKMPLRQLLVTTHSPELVSQLNIEAGELLFASMPTRVGGGRTPMQVTRMFPVSVDTGKNTPEGAYSLTNVLAYLSGNDVQAVRNKLREARLR